MKSVVIENKFGKKPKCYPYLGRYTSGTFIVMFTKPGYGVVVNAGESVWDIGKISTWSEISFTMIDSEVVLSND